MIMLGTTTGFYHQRSGLLSRSPCSIVSKKMSRLNRLPQDRDQIFLLVLRGEIFLDPSFRGCRQWQATAAAVSSRSLVRPTNPKQRGTQMLHVLSSKPRRMRYHMIPSCRSYMYTVVAAPATSHDLKVFLRRISVWQCDGGSPSDGSRSAASRAKPGRRSRQVYYTSSSVFENIERMGFHRTYTSAIVFPFSFLGVVSAGQRAPSTACQRDVLSRNRFFSTSYRLCLRWPSEETDTTYSRQVILKSVLRAPISGVAPLRFPDAQKFFGVVHAANNSGQWI